jgi:hypothetical protein
MKNVKRILSAVLVALMILTCFAACGTTPQKAILGSWRDSTATTGYEFKEGNACVITYADVTLPFIGSKYNGSVDGVYTIEETEDGTCYVTLTLDGKVYTWKVTITGNPDTADKTRAAIFTVAGAVTAGFAALSVAARRFFGRK